MTSDSFVCVKNTFIDFTFEPPCVELCRARSEFKPCVDGASGGPFSTTLPLTLEPLRCGIGCSRSSDDDSRTSPLAKSIDESVYMPEDACAQGSDSPFVISIKNTFISVAEAPRLPDALRRAQSDRHWRPSIDSDAETADTDADVGDDPPAPPMEELDRAKTIDGYDPITFDTGAWVSEVDGTVNLDMSLPDMSDLERAQTLDGYDSLPADAHPYVVMAEDPVQHLWGHSALAAAPLLDVQPPAMYFPMAVPLVMLPQDVAWGQKWPLGCHGQVLHQSWEQATVGKSVRFSSLSSVRGPGLDIVTQQEQEQQGEVVHHEKQRQQQQQRREQHHDEEEKNETEAEQQQQQQQQQQQEEQEQQQKQQQQQQQQQQQAKLRELQLQPLTEASPEIAAPGVLGLGRLSSERDVVQHFVWRVDARKLRSSDRRAASPVFSLRLSGSAECEPAQFKILIRPTSVAETKGGSSFKKAKGRGALELNCLQSLDPGCTRSVRFRLAVGSQPPRGPVRHDFSLNTLCGLPEDLEQWDFSKEVDPLSDTFEVHLEVSTDDTALGEGDHDIGAHAM